MAQREFPIVAADLLRQRKRAAPKGRGVDPSALAEVRALLVDASRARDQPIEHLHRIQDRYGHLSAAHLAALAAEMDLAQTEVYEVASFYHHFEVVKEDAEGRIAPAPALTARVCDGLACEMAGARGLLARLPDLLVTDVRVFAAPCDGRCETVHSAAGSRRDPCRGNARCRGGDDRGARGVGRSPGVEFVAHQ